MDGEDVDAGGAEDRLLPWRRVRDMAGISRSTAWRMQQTGDFPSPVAVSPGRVGWWESELTAWKGARGTARAPRPPLRPRLPGMPRMASGRAGASEAIGGGEQDRAPQAGQEGPTARARKRRAGTVHADQIDFGF